MGIFSDGGDIRKKRGSSFGANKKKLSAEDAKRIAKTDPAYKSVDKDKRKEEKKRGENKSKRRNTW